MNRSLWNTGILKIFEVYSKEDKKPRIEVSSNAFKITLPSCNYEDKDGAGWNKTYQPKTEKEIIVDYILKNGWIRRSEVEKLLDVSKATSNRILNSLLKTRGKSTKYKLISL